MIYLIGLYVFTRDFVSTFWLGLLATLPLAKGKTLSFEIISKADLINRNAVFDINYIFSVYLADFVLGLLIWQLVRQILTWSKPKWLIWGQIFYQQRWLGLSFLGFLLVCLLPQLDSKFSTIVWLSSLQLIKLAGLFLIPSLIFTKIGVIEKATWQILLGGIFFQTAWASWQFHSGGPIGKYLEAILPLGNTNEAVALGTMENPDLLRVTGTFFDPSLLATYLVTVMIWLWWERHRIQPKWLIWAGLIAGSGSLILTSNRILMIFLGFWWLWQAYHWVRTWHWQRIFDLARRRLWLILGGLALGIWLLPYILARFTTLGTAFDTYGSGTYRIQLGWYAMRLGFGQPWGVGLNLSPYYLATQFNQETVSFDPSHPHNLFLQIFAETGWLGLVLALSWLYLIYRPIQIGKKLDWQLTSWGAGGLAFLIAAQFYPVFLSQIEVVSWLALMLGGHWAWRLNQIQHQKLELS